jgi:metal-responsive CopG/Arc/MetJ family transcriptional regulator
MKSKTSITLPSGLLEDLDRIAGGAGNRSRTIEIALREYIKGLLPEARELLDSELINRNADFLNREAKESLSYQVK